MKKIALLLVIVIFLSTMLTSCSMLPDYVMREVYDFFGGGRKYSKEINYQLDRNGYGYSASKFYCSDNDVRIRPTFKNKPVTTIEDYTFSACDNINSVTIPDGVTSIGNYAFFSCRNLTRVTIGNSVASIGEAAFGGCISLESINIPDSVTSIGEGAFFHCENLTSVTIPDSVTHLGAAAFSCCDSLTYVTIPEGILALPEGLFSGCDLLTIVTIPSSVLAIDAQVFQDCKNLTKIYFRGTEAEWNKISKASGWDKNTGNYTIIFNYTGK